MMAINDYTITQGSFDTKAIVAQGEWDVKKKRDSADLAASNKKLNIME